MARNYTDAEVRNATSKLVRTTIRRELGALGNRRTDLEFSDIQDAAIGTFVLERGAPFYVVRLGADVLSEVVTSLDSVLADLVDTIRATSSRRAPVTKISSLANARSALRALGSATSARSSSLVGVTDIPAFKRFEQATSRFLQDEGVKISSSEGVIQTREEARGRLAGLVADVRAGHVEVLRRVDVLRGAIAEFDSLRLPSKFSDSIVRNATAVLDGRYAELEALRPEERLGLLREVVLDVLATRAVVRGFGSLTPSVTFTYFGGSGGPFADPAHPATPAFITADRPGPYALIGDVDLDLVVDGSTPVTVSVPESYVAAVSGTFAEPFYTSYNADTGLTFNKLFIDSTGHARVTATLTVATTAPNAPVSASTVVADINGAIASTAGPPPLIAEPLGLQTYLRSAPANVSGSSGARAAFTRVGSTWGDIVGFAVQVGDWLSVSDSLDNAGWWRVADVSGLPATFLADRETGVALDEVDVLVSINRGGRAVGIRYTDAHGMAAVTNRETISMPVDGDAEVQGTLDLLGITRGISVRSQPTPVEDCVTFINGNPAVAPGGVARVEASSTFRAAHSGVVRTDPLDGTVAIFSSLEVTSDVIGGAPATVVLAENDVSQLAVGDVCVLRSTTNNVVDAWGVVTSLGPTSASVSPSTGSWTTESSVGLEFGPDLRTSGMPAKLIVFNDPPNVNDGEYDVLGLDGTVTLLSDRPPLAVVIARPFIVASGVGSVSLRAQGQLGHAYLSLTSLSTGLHTALSVEGSAAASFYLSVPSTSVGKTEWFGLPEPPSRVEPGDFLELHDSASQAPTYSIEIEAKGSNPNVLRLVSLLDVDQGTWSLVQGAQAPYGRVRVRKSDDYALLKEGLDAWVLDPTQNVARYYSTLHGAINALVVNENPSAADVASAVLHVLRLQSQLTQLQVYLSAYEADLVERVDVLIDTYLENGGRRAVDLLVEGRFADFFGLSQDESSYSGDLQKSLRDVARNDLPVRRVRQNPGGVLVDSYETPDYEFDISDVDEEEVPIPGELSEYVESSF